MENFWDQIVEFFTSMWDSIVGFFTNLFGGNDEE